MSRARTEPCIPPPQCQACESNLRYSRFSYSGRSRCSSLSIDRCNLRSCTVARRATPNLAVVKVDRSCSVLLAVFSDRISCSVLSIRST